MSNSEYLARHNRALMILAVTWAKEKELIGDDKVWYKEPWEQGTVLEKDEAKLVWDSLFKLRKTETARRPDLILETKDEKQVWMFDMGCPSNKILIRNEEISLCNIDNLLLRQEKEDRDTLLRLYPS